MVLTRLAVGLKIAGAELGFVLIWMVELFDTIMSTFTHISSLASSALSSHLRTNLRLVSTKRSPTVLVIVMVEWAALQIMILRIQLAGLDLELKKVKEHGGLLHADMTCVEAIAVRLVGVWANALLMVVRLGRASLITRATTIIINIVHVMLMMAHLICMLIKLLLLSRHRLLLDSRRVKDRLS